jgi:hypothetical protein
MTKIKACERKCKHKFQDTQYGKHVRVHNSLHKDNRIVVVGWRCTVCGNTVLN